MLGELRDEVEVTSGIVRSTSDGPEDSHVGCAVAFEDGKQVLSGLVVEYVARAGERPDGGEDAGSCLLGTSPTFLDG